MLFSQLTPVNTRGHLNSPVYLKLNVSEKSAGAPCVPSRLKARAELRNQIKMFFMNIIICICAIMGDSQPLRVFLHDMPDHLLCDLRSRRQCVRK